MPILWAQHGLLDRLERDAVFEMHTGDAECDEKKKGELGDAHLQGSTGEALEKPISRRFVFTPFLQKDTKIKVSLLDWREEVEEVPDASLAACPARSRQGKAPDGRASRYATLLRSCPMRPPNALVTTS